MKEIKFGISLITLGTDSEKKFAWCLRSVNGVVCICLHERTTSGGSCFNEKDFVTSIPLDILESVKKANILSLKEILYAANSEYDRLNNEHSGMFPEDYRVYFVQGFLEQNYMHLYSYLMQNATCSHR